MRTSLFTKSAPPSQAAEDPEMDSVFNWAKNPRAWMYLTGFLFFSLIIHGAGFYLFKVVYPAPTRIEAKGESVTLMDSSDPGVRALMKRIEDRTVFFFPPSKNAGIRMDVGKSDVRYSPSHRDANLNLMQPAYSWSLPPALDVTRPSGSLAAPNPRFEITPSGKIAERKIAPWSLLRDYLEQLDALPPLSVVLTVSREGNVSVSAVEGELSESDRKQFAEVVETTLRFLPAEESTKGRMTIRERPESSQQRIETE